MVVKQKRCSHFVRIWRADVRVGANQIGVSIAAKVDVADVDSQIQDACRIRRDLCNQDTKNFFTTFYFESAYSLPMTQNDEKGKVHAAKEQTQKILVGLHLDKFKLR